MEKIQTGRLIRSLRVSKKMTQKQLAQKLNVSDRAVSKWECGLGLPDVQLLENLSAIFNISIEQLLKGDLEMNDNLSGNMKKSKFYVCPECGNISVCMSGMQVSCCSKILKEAEPEKASDENKLTVEEIENDWYITSNHEMSKDNYISFAAFVTADSVQIIKQYPQWNLQVYLPKRKHGKLLWYSRDNGLLYQLI